MHTVIRDFLVEKKTESKRELMEKRHATYFMTRLATLSDHLAAVDSSEAKRRINSFDADWENFQAGLAWAEDRSEKDEDASNL